MVRYLSLVLILSAGVAAAQDLQYSNDLTAACVYAQPTLAGQKTCIGRSAQACMDATSMGNTTVGMGGCVSYELEYWDTRLNAAYKTQLAKAKAWDVEMRELGSSAESMEDALRNMQRSWIPWRDATCGFERAQWGGGTGGGPATYACLVRLTGEQALYLETSQVGE